jgi:hypothetical protein
VTRRRILAIVWLAPTALFLAITALVTAHHRLDVPPRLDGPARAAVMAILRAGLEQAPAPAASALPALARPLADRGPLLATVWLDGRRKARAIGHGATVAEAAVDAANQLAVARTLAELTAEQRTTARIQVDLVVARGPLGASKGFLRWLAFSGLDELTPLDPGADGIGATVEATQPRPETREIVLAPYELVEHRLLNDHHPVPTIPDWTMGLDVDRAEGLLAQRAALPPGGWGLARRTLWRHRTDTFVERPAASRGDGPPLALDRGAPPGPPVTPDTLRAAALAGARYLVGSLASSGRYYYERNLGTGGGTNPDVAGPYSIPRHAGTTYFLAEVYRITREDFLREPIERAFSHLQELIVAGGCTGSAPDGAEMACVVDRGDTTAGLGSTALTVVALVEYQRATGDDRYLPLARKLTAWIRFMQRPDGSFAHVYDLRTGKRDERAQVFYYSGEAALALARMHTVTGEAAYATAAGAALDWLVGQYDFFLGGFVYGEEHWTCIAAEAAWPAVKNPRYVEFCDGYGAFLRAQQPGPGDVPTQADLAGAYGITPFVMPYNTPAGSRTEAMISAYLLGRHHGRADERIRHQILAALAYTLRQQVRPDSDWNVAPPRAGGGTSGVGAVTASPIERGVRIDYVQHVGSAMIRAVELAAPPPR